MLRINKSIILIKYTNIQGQGFIMTLGCLMMGRRNYSVV